MAKKKIDYASMFTHRKDGRYVTTYTDETGRHHLYDKDPERLYQRLQELSTPKEKKVPTFAQIAEDWERMHREEITVRNSLCNTG